MKLLPDYHRHHCPYHTHISHKVLHVGLYLLPLVNHHQIFCLAAVPVPEENGEELMRVWESNARKKTNKIKHVIMIINKKSLAWKQCMVNEIYFWISNQSWLLKLFNPDQEKVQFFFSQQNWLIKFNSLKSRRAFFNCKISKQNESEVSNNLLVSAQVFM